MSSRDIESDLAAAFGCAYGAYLFYRGFQELKLKKLVQGMATSKVRSMAMGMVELCGSARQSRPIVDPVYELPCAYYNVEVKERQGLGKHQRWVTIYRNTSSAFPFYLADDTGEALIFPHGAELYFENDMNLTVGGLKAAFAGPDGPVERFAAKLRGPSSELNIKASIIREHEPIYCLGYVVSADDPFTLPERASQAVGRARLSLAELARNLKADPARMRDLDKNRDGQIDAQEWDEGLRRYQKETLAEAEKEEAQARRPAPAAPRERVFLVRKSPHGLFVLSDSPEKDFVARIGRLAFLKILGGPALALACAYCLGLQFGFF